MSTIPTPQFEGRIAGRAGKNFFPTAAMYWSATLMLALMLTTVMVRRAESPRSGVNWNWAQRIYAAEILAKARAQERVQTGGITHIEIGSKVVQAGVHRMGMNLGDQYFYGSGQMMKNLVVRNAGFEGKTWQSILHCKVADANHCTDGMQAAAWGDGFWTGASYEVIVSGGGAEGRTGHVTASRKADASRNGQGVMLTLDGNAGLRAGDYIVVRKRFPGGADAGWWIENGGGRVETEFRDLSARTAGKQALKVDAAGAGKTMGVAAYFDSTEGRTFLRINGKYRITFRAKLLSGNPMMQVAFTRQTNPVTNFYVHDVQLNNQWQDYSFDFDAHDSEGTIGSLRLRFGIAGATVLLDDVSLERVDGDAANTTAFRDEVVDALNIYRPGVLRYMASATGLGSSVVNLEAPEFARERSDYSAWAEDQPAVPYGLADFLGLCVKVHADPWIVLPAASSTSEAAQLVGWLQEHGWTRSFGKIHIELGNETWNSIFYGETFDDPAAYGHRASVVFGAMRRARGFDAAKFDLIAGGFVDLPERNGEIVRNATGADSLAIAPYLMRKVDTDEPAQKLFGPLFAEPQMMTRPGGLVEKNKNVATGAGKHLAIYEVNLHTTDGGISEGGLNRLTPSLGAGLAVAEHMLLMLRDEGATTQAMFSLPGYNYKRNDGKLVKLWGTTVDMGATNRKRPQFLALQMVNGAMLGELVETRFTGFNPAWSEIGGNDGVTLNDAHEIEAFAFAGNGRHSLVLMNLSLTEAHTVELGGENGPHGVAAMETLDASSVEANNEDWNAVGIKAGSFDFSRGGRLVLAPHSLVTLSW